MFLKRPKDPASTLVVLDRSPTPLEDNPLRDPYVRKVLFWLPPQRDRRRRGSRGSRFLAFLSER